MDTGEAPEAVALVADRITVLEYLADGPAHKRTMVADLPPSRSTIDRAVRALVDADLVERTPDGYRATAAGRLAAERYRAFLADEAAILDAREFLAALPSDVSLPAAVLADATVESPGDGSADPLAALVDPITTADHHRAVLPRIDDSRHLRLCHRRAVDDGRPVELLLSARAVETLTTEFATLTGELAAADAVTAYEVPDPPFACYLAATDDATHVAVATTTEDGDGGGILHATGDAAVDWATDWYAARRDEGTDVTARLRREARAAGAGTDGSRADADTPRGFDRVDTDALATCDPGPALRGWQTGFDLAAVAAGHHVDRHHPGADDADTDDAADSLAAAFRDRLADGPLVVRGPSGSGRRTTCRAVAARWLEATDGTLLHRPSPAPDAPPDADALVGALDAIDGPTLVLVEDATDPRVQAAVECCLTVGRERDEVAVLLAGDTSDPADLADTGDTDALATCDPADLADTGDPADLADTGDPADLADTGTGTDDAQGGLPGEVALGDLPAVTLPPVDAATVRRAVDRFAAVTDRAFDTAALADRLAADPPATMADLADRLDAATDPDAPTGATPTAALDARVRAAYDAVGECVDDLDAGSLDAVALEATLVAAALGAADRQVSPAVLHAVAAGRAAADPGDGVHTAAHRRVDDVVATLDGTVLYDDPDRRTFHTRNPSWLRRFLAHALERDGDAAVAAFERGLNAVLAFADDTARLDHVEHWLGQPPGDLLATPLVADRDGIARSVFALAARDPALASLVGTSAASGIDLSPCSERTRLACRAARLAVWWGDAVGEVEASSLLRAVLDTDVVDESTRVALAARAHRRLSADRPAGSEIH
jgi:predicted transcriptional regulator